MFLKIRYIGIDKKCESYCKNVFYLCYTNMKCNVFVRQETKIGLHPDHDVNFYNGKQDRDFFLPITKL